MTTSARSLAVTGLGAVTALGPDAPSSFARLLEGARGFEEQPGGKLVAKVPEAYLGPRRDASDRARGERLAQRAVREALGAARLEGVPFGLVVGTTTGSVVGLEALLAREADATERAAHFARHNLASVARALRHEFEGAVLGTTLCSACSSGAMALVLGAEWLRSGRVPAVLVGGVDACCTLTELGFASLGLLSPTGCRPFDERRDGLTLGEGAGFLVLELTEHARARGANILAFLSGYSAGAEAFHLTQPEPTGRDSAQLLARALSRAPGAEARIDYVNAHGTGTPSNDRAEALALAQAFAGHAEAPWVSSSKGQLGHTLGAAGALEAVFTVLALARQELPASGGLEVPMPGLRHVGAVGHPAPLRAACSTSFGFGGVGVALVFDTEEPRHTEQPRQAVAITRAVRLPETQPFSALDELEPERSRRFDAQTAVTAACAARLLAPPLEPDARLGLVSGLLHGNIRRTVQFLERAIQRGAAPAEFPHILPSSIAGNASLYAGLRGPVLAVAEPEAWVASALSVAAELLAGGEADAMLAGAAEGSGMDVNDTEHPERGLFFLLEPAARLSEQTAVMLGATGPATGAMPALARGEVVFVLAHQRHALPKPLAEAPLRMVVAEGALAGGELLFEAVQALRGGELEAARVVEVTENGVFVTALTRSAQNQP